MARRTLVFSALLVALVLLSTAPITAQTPEKQKYVIFRDDDVGMGNETNALKAVNQIHVDEGVPVTLGIVPHPYPQLDTRVSSDVPDPWIVLQADSGVSNQLSHNSAFFEYMRSIRSNPLFEFAQHGHTHQSNGLWLDPHDTSEFAGEPYLDQHEAIREGQNEIKEAFGITPTTFIPPWDRGDADTRTAARELGFTHYNTGGTEMKRLQGSVDGMRVEAASLDIYGSSYAALNESVHRAREQTDQFFSDPKSDTLIVCYHFWTFSGPRQSVDLEKLRLLRDYVTYVKSYRSASFTRLDRSVTLNYDFAPAVSEEPVAPSSSSQSVSSDTFFGLHYTPAVFLPIAAAAIALFGLSWLAWEPGGRNGDQKE